MDISFLRCGLIAASAKKTYPPPLKPLFFNSKKYMKKSLQKIKQDKRNKRRKRIRAKIFGTQEKPRFSVFRSLKYIYAQLINDEKGETLAAASDHDIKDKGKKKKEEISKEVGKLIAKKAIEKKISQVVFDKGGYKYHGRIKSLAEGAREGGLKF
ncbi:MAG: large subunit ribosomal protein L18 [Parcubacteria group bacterium Athens1014_10]|nr:MAG: large subunit ribosomal protein L18 [Parcubacteria group bacterium Athens1014_10]TSD05483.1 MAG: large subunit ribosomal protein L18 [Parcubacteria group bacterium Athens0714_12]